ncbi:hypothetical protein Tco_0335051 [Tanacetum coccineum]
MVISICGWKSGVSGGLPDIASADMGMLDGFDHGLQTIVQVLVNFDYTMRRSINVMGKSIIRYRLMIQGCARKWEANLQHMEAFLTTEAGYMMFTKAVKEICLAGKAVATGKVAAAGFEKLLPPYGLMITVKFIIEFV